MGDLRATFDSFDGDSNGQIDLKEFRSLLVELGEQHEPAAAEALFDGIDADETGLIEFAEFEAWWKTR